MDVYFPKWLLSVLGVVLVGGIAVGVAVLTDSGGDGNGSAPTSEQASVPTTTERESVTTPPDTGPPDCEVLRQAGKEGRCQFATRSGSQQVVVVNRDSVLHLNELDARLVDVQTAKVLTDVGVERANGVYLIFTLQITNNLHSPVTFDESQDQVIFTAGHGTVDQYTEDFDAENGGDKSSFLWRGQEIQPGTTQTGTVIFDVPPEAVEEVDRTGGIAIVNFSDAGNFRRPNLPFGTIRTYPPKS